MRSRSEGGSTSKLRFALSLLVLPCAFHSIQAARRGSTGGDKNCSRITFEKVTVQSLPICPGRRDGYSFRNATIGSTFVARRAGR
jgi:hypothetical protein